MEDPSALESFCGRAPVDRSLEVLDRAGFRLAEEVALVCRSDLEDELLRSLAAAGRAVPVIGHVGDLVSPHGQEATAPEWRTTGQDAPGRALSADPKSVAGWLRRRVEGGDAGVLALAGDRIVDPRLHAALLERRPPTLPVASAPPASGVTPASPTLASPVADPAPSTPPGRLADELDLDLGVALLSVDRLLRSVERKGVPSWPDLLGRLAADEGTERLPVEKLPTYRRELRRHLPVHSFRVDTPERRRDARRFLVRASGKGHQELPVILLNRPVEEWIMGWLGDTRVSPNALTLLCNLVAYTVTALFAGGRLVLGTALALVVGVLDGLDGRQARIQLRTSEAGRIEHLLDKLFEMSWIVALGWHFWRIRGGDPLWLWATVTWIGLYILDSGAYDLFKARTGMQLDEASKIDRAIRLVAGRRNVYVFMLAAGLLVGRPAATFLVIVGWAAATALVHWIRVAWLLTGGDHRLRRGRGEESDTGSSKHGEGDPGRG